MQLAACAGRPSSPASSISNYSYENGYGYSCLSDWRMATGDCLGKGTPWPWVSFTWLACVCS
eukprot:scaffold424834_cov17-Prasinocladus_malaysianus.AAC.1